jgi:serine/threonine-protein phosphatase 2B catalytic subunit
MRCGLSFLCSHNSPSGKYKYGMDFYNEVMLAFDALPLAALVTNAQQERFFCVHGGISPYIMTMEDVETIDRFGDIPNDGPICDLVWSDPVYKEEGMSQEDYLEMRWNSNEKRRISWTFGWGVLESFLLENNLQSVVRAHEVKQEGFEEHWYGATRDTRKYPPLVTVFSAPNYCDMYRNKASVLVIQRETGFAFEKLVKRACFSLCLFHLLSVFCFLPQGWTDHPFMLPDFNNAINFSLPHLIGHMSSMIIGLLKVVRGGAEVDATTKRKLDMQIGKIERWNSLSRKVQDERQAIFQELRYLSESADTAELFARVMEVDASMEMLSPVSAAEKKEHRVKRSTSTYF